MRLLVLTDPDFYTIFSRKMEDKRAPGLELKLVELSAEILQRVRDIKIAASKEVSAPPRPE